MEHPIVDGIFVLKKGNGKGAWTFAELPILDNVPKKRYSTVRVRGCIDDYELQDFHIWAMKKGTFLSVNAGVRAAIKKAEGESVRITLYLDEAPMVIPEDFLVCLQDEPKLHAKFDALAEALKQRIVNWIFSAKTDEEIVSRMGKAMDALEHGRETSIA